MKFRKLLSALLFAAGVLFVAGFTPAESPTEVAKKYLEALKKCDFRTAAELCYGSMKKDIEGGEKQYKAAAPEQRKQMREFLVSFSNGVELKEEKIEGDFAVIECVQNGESGTVYFKKVDGEWKLINYDEYKKTDTPIEVVKKFGEAVTKYDLGTAAALCYGKLKADVEEMGRQYKAASPEEQREMRKYMASFTDGVALKGETIEGDYAVVEMIQDGKIDNGHLKKVNGEWKCIDKSEYRK